VIPHADNVPPHLPQFPIDKFIPRLVAAQFLHPKFLIVLRCIRVDWTAVPETAINMSGAI
jgi:hypothetical protein